MDLKDKQIINQLQINGKISNIDLAENNRVAGVVTGLAWTSVGGDILFIESTMSKGKGNLSITGNLGKVMKESSTIALEYLKSKGFKVHQMVHLILNCLNSSHKMFFSSKKHLNFHKMRNQRLLCMFRRRASRLRINC